MPRDGDRKEGGYQKYTLDQIADENFFVPASKIDAALAAKYDYVVVGTGPCSYSFIKKLVMSTKRDCQILVLERGGFFLPDHVQALDPVFGGMVGGIAETFPFIRAKEMTERDPAVYMHGPVNVVGGRSTVWTAWAPWPEVNDTANTNPTELRGFPVDHAAAVKVHKATAELYINADGKSNASIYKPDALPFSEGFVDHLNRTFNQQELDVYSNTEPDARILPHVTTKFNKAYLAPIAANRANSMNPFGKFTTTAPLLKLLKALVPQTPSDDTAAPFWKRKTVPSFLYVLYTTFLDIANFTVKSRDTGKTWTRRETVDCLAAIWSKWAEGVVAGQLSVPQGHTTHVAQQLFFDICQVYGNPFKVLTYPFSKYGKALLDIITPRQDTRADREKLGEAEVYFDMYAMGTFHYKKTKVDTFDYYINGDSNVLPNVSITCVVNACVTKLINDSKTGCVSDIELLLNNRFNFNHCGEKSILCSNPDCGCTASETSANCSKRSIDCRGSRIVLGMGMYPAANLLMDSFPDDQSIGQDVGAHWCSSVVCRLPRDDGLRVLEKAIARGDPSVTAGLKAAFDGEDYSEAIYVTGYNEVSNGKTKIAANEWHSQLSVIIPSYTAGGRSIATLAAAVPGGPDSMVRTSDPDYVYFNFSNLGEAMTNEVENKLVEESGIEMDIRKNNYYRKDTSVPSEDIVLPGTRRDGGEGLLNIQLSKMDYTAWQKSVEMPVAIMEALFGNVKKTLSYYNKTTKQWLTAEDLHNAGSSDDAKYRLNKYADFSSMGMVHDGCVLQIDTDGNHNNGSVYSVGTAETHGKLPYQYKKASNVFITGSGLLPSTASWNPTGYICAMAIHLAHTLIESDLETTPVSPTVVVASGAAAVEGVKLRTSHAPTEGASKGKHLHKIRPLFTN